MDFWQQENKVKNINIRKRSLYTKNEQRKKVYNIVYINVINNFNRLLNYNCFCNTKLFSNSPELWEKLKFYNIYKNSSDFLSDFSYK